MNIEFSREMLNFNGDYSNYNEPHSGFLAA